MGKPNAAAPGARRSAIGPGAASFDPYASVLASGTGNRTRRCDEASGRLRRGPKRSDASRSLTVMERLHHNARLFPYTGQVKQYPP